MSGFGPLTSSTSANISSFILTQGSFRCVLLLIYVAILTMTSSLAGPLPVSSTTRRWFYPCRGADSRVDVFGDVTDATMTSETSTPASVSTSGNTDNPVTSFVVDPRLADSFHAISTRATRLKRHVRELKELYVAQRFRDNSIVEDLEQMGVRLDGMPETSASTIERITTVNAGETIQRTFEHLARVAVFIDQARIGESLAINEQVSYEHHFERIEDHHDHGLYWLLCAVQRLVHVTGSTVDDDVIDAVSRMRVVEVDRNALRHTRDYLVLRDFERILARLGLEFAALRHLHRRHHSSSGHL